MENTNEILNKIVNQSIRNVICVDDDFLAPYEAVTEADKEKHLFSKQMYSGISSSCECAVTIVPYKQEVDINVINAMMRQKDLLILDWELSKVEDIKKPIEIIDGALSNNVQYICIYTNTPNLTGICETLRLYYCGFSKSEVENVANQCEEQGLLKDEFATDIIECFERKNGNIKILKDKAKELGVTVNIDGIEETSKKLWYMLYFAWSDKLLPEKNEFVAYDKGDDGTVLNIDGRLVFIYGKSAEKSGEQIDKILPENIIPSIAKHMVESPNSILDALWLYYFNLFQAALYKRTDFFKNISSDAFFYHASKMFDEEGQDDVEIFFKESFKEEMTQRIDVENIAIPDEILQIMVDKGKNIEPANILDELVKLNERITINRSLSNIFHNIGFGDLFQCVNADNGLCEFWLCITAKCDCRRPEKISNNYIFIGGNRCKNKHAIAEAEKQYFSYADLGNEENCNVVAVKWGSKINSIYIIDNNVKRGKIIQGNIRDMQKNFKYIGNVKENFAQRMANMAFADGNRVGISLAKMEREE